jgi:hypothetical protein
MEDSMTSREVLASIRNMIDDTGEPCRRSELNALKSAL